MFGDEQPHPGELFFDVTAPVNIIWLRLQVAAAVVHGSVTKTTRLPDKSSIFRAELHAISLALAVVRRTKEKNFIIFSDSM